MSTMKTIHTKTVFRDDLRYARLLIGRIERAIKTGDWEAVEADAYELEPLFSWIRSRATDNKEGILDFDCKHPMDIAEIRAEQEAERKREEQKQLAAWHKTAEDAAREFEKFLGIKVTVVTEDLETK